MKLAAVITGGSAPPPSTANPLLAQCFFIVAADSGLDTAANYDCVIDEALGDFDSYSGGYEGAKAMGIPLSSFKRDKDYSDTELAVQSCIRAGASHLVLIGGGGGRLDHSLANIHLVQNCELPVIWISGDSEMLVLEKGQYHLESLKNRTLSLVPLGQESPIIQSAGLQWPVHNLDWKSIGLSLSNVCISDNLSLELVSGSVLFVLPFSDGIPVLGLQIISLWRGDGE